jgi:hypothetical protein
VPPIKLSAKKSARPRALLPKIYEQWRGLVSNGGQVVQPVGGACCGNGAASERCRKQLLQKQGG